jgi:uncharacterized protein (TIGR03437 family)
VSQSKWVSGALLCLTLVLPSLSSLTTLQAASESSNLICGTYPNRVITELGLHAQFQQKRASQRIFPLRDATTAAFDAGNIAVVPDDGTLVTSQNPFDLDGRTLTFTPVGTGYTVSAGASGFDSGAADFGELLNPLPASNPQNIGDDGTRPVTLPFGFRFFGQIYDSVFVNSDGNLTFSQGDDSSNSRSLARFLNGPPRIAPFFTDLDPSASGRLVMFSSASRFVMSWTGVPDFAGAGTGPRETFQIVLFPDGKVTFAYNGINGREAVVGISAGSLNEAPPAVDLSGTNGGVVIQGAIAEVFSTTNDLDTAAVAKRFYQTHDDAYQYLVIFTNFNFDMDGAFAFELNISNQVTGIGRIGNSRTFDFSNQFGSNGRLESLLNMGNLARYPADPNTVFLRGVDSTLTIMGQESGHRFMSYVYWADPNGSRNSTALLGRDLQHWSFYFNSDASVMEGNLIRDNNNGTFTTTGAVQHYNEIDEYLMGLRLPHEVGPSFVVKNPSPALNPGTAPTLNVNFSGTRANVLLDQIIAANGPRLPNAAFAPNRFKFAFILVTDRNTPATADQIAKVDRIRSEWERFFNRAVSFRGTAETSLVRSMSLQPSSVGLLTGSTVSARIKLGATVGVPVLVRLTNTNSSAVTLPSQVTIPAGASSADFPINAVGPGRVRIDAQAEGFEIASGLIEVLPDISAGTATMAMVQGNNQLGPLGAGLPSALRIRLLDANQTPYAAIPVQFSVTAGTAALSASDVVTDAYGFAETNVQLGPSPGPINITARVPGAALRVDFSATAVDGPFVPAVGVVNGASFLPGGAAISPGGIISIFGTKLSVGTASAATFPLPTTLGETRVELNGAPLSLFYVSPSQINALAPADQSPATRVLVVRSGTGASPTITVPFRRAAPGIFSLDSSGRGPGAILHAGTSINVTATSPAVPGEYVSIFATGLGAVSPAASIGQPAPSTPASRTTLAVSASIRGIPAVVDFAGLAPGYAGLYQVNMLVPEVAAGTAEVLLSVDGVSSNAVSMEVGAR